MDMIASDLLSLQLSYCTGNLGINAKKSIVIKNKVATVNPRIQVYTNSKHSCK